MAYLSTTDLRMKTSQLVSFLVAGKSVNLLHRSRVVGKIVPVVGGLKLDEGVDIDELREFLKKAGPKVVIRSKERERIYKKHLMSRYGR